MNLRLIPPLLLVIGSLAFIFFTTNQMTNKTSIALKAAETQKITIEGKLEKYTICPSAQVCHFVVDHGIRYNLDNRKYPNISEHSIDLDSLTNSKVKITGLWISGRDPYLVIINLTSL